jgi:hypothetical protein
MGRCLGTHAQSLRHFEADNPRKPIDLVKALPHHKVAKANEFLQKLLHGDDSDLES